MTLNRLSKRGRLPGLAHCRPERRRPAPASARMEAAPWDQDRPVRETPAGTVPDGGRIRNRIDIGASSPRASKAELNTRSRDVPPPPRSARSGPCVPSPRPIEPGPSPAQPPAYAHDRPPHRALPAGHSRQHRNRPAHGRLPRRRRRRHRAGRLRPVRPGAEARRHGLPVERRAQPASRLGGVRRLAREDRPPPRALDDESLAPLHRRGVPPGRHPPLRPRKRRRPRRRPCAGRRPHPDPDGRGPALAQYRGRRRDDPRGGPAPDATGSAPASA